MPPRPMTATPRRLSIPVTGMAWTTALGCGLDAVWRRLLEGQSGLVEMPAGVRLRNYLAAPVSDDSLPATTTTGGARADSPGCRLHRMATGTIAAALADAELKPDDPRIDLVIGTSLGDFLEGEPETRVRMGAWADDVARELGLRNPPVSLSTACSSASDAQLVGAELIRSGASEICVCGGADVLTLAKRMAHSALGTLSPDMLRAFDTRHDGTLLGEGAAFLVLEAPHLERQRRLHATLRGAGSGNDAASMSAPDSTGKGAWLAVERSLADAGLAPGEVGLVNAHGSGTPLNDAAESDVLRGIFKDTPAGGTLVFATKGNFGHSLGATGSIEAVALILALQQQQAPPIVGLSDPRPMDPLRLAGSHAHPVNTRCGLSLTLGFGGFDTSLVFEVAP